MAEDNKEQPQETQDAAAALNPQSGANLTEEQRKHREELYGYQKDEEGTLDTSARLEDETTGIPDDTTGNGLGTSSITERFSEPGFNNPLNDNNG